MKKTLAIFLALFTILFTSCSSGAAQRKSADNRVFLSLDEFTKAFNETLNPRFEKITGWKDGGSDTADDGQVYKRYSTVIEQGEFYRATLSVGVDENNHVTFCQVLTYTVYLEYLEAYYTTAANLLDRQMSNEKCIEILKENNVYNKNYYKEDNYYTYTDNDYVRYGNTIEYNNETGNTLMYVVIRMAPQ